MTPCILPEIPSFWSQHKISFAIFVVFQTYGCLPWFANFRLIAEFSTPFVNQRSVVNLPILCIFLQAMFKVEVKWSRNVSYLLLVIHGHVHKVQELVCMPPLHYLFDISAFHRWFLHSMGHNKESELYVINGLAMCAMFFMVRIISMPPYWYKVYSIYNTASAARLGNLWYILIFSCMVLDLLNLIWFKKMVTGARKVLRALRDDKALKIKAS